MFAAELGSSQRPSIRQLRVVLVSIVVVGVLSSAGVLTAAPAGGVIGGPGPVDGVYAAQSSPPSGVYEAIAPERMLDTRVGLGAQTPGRDSILSLRIAGKGSVPGAATAVVINLTVTNTNEEGFVSVWPTGRKRPLVSSLNPQRRAQTIANLVTVPVGTGGRISLYTQRGADLIVDVQGYYVNAKLGRAGRLDSIAPKRVLDTRQSGGRFGVRTARTFDLAGVGGITRGSRAAVLNVTVDDAAEPGYWSVYPAKTPRPEASNLNVEFSGQTIANQVVVGLKKGRFTVYSQRGGELIVDVVGSYTGSDAKKSADGRFVPVNPTRLIDTRSGIRPSASSTTEVPVLGKAGLGNSGVAAVVLNLTVTESVDEGYFTAWPSRTYRPVASSVNATAPQQTIANHVVTPISSSGVGVFTQRGGHILADIAGYFTGKATASNLPRPVPLQNPNSPGASTDYAFSASLGPGGLIGGGRGGDPIRWDPCRSIRYVVNYGGQRAIYRPLVREAFDRLSAATGLRFIEQGESAFIPTSANPHPFSPGEAFERSNDFDLVVAFSDSRQTDLVPGSVAGSASVAWVGAAGAKPNYVLASVVIDHSDVGNSPPWSSIGAGPVLLHELAHVVGLSHSSSAQLMSPVAQPGAPTSYRSGDLAGLWHEGSFSASCGSATALGAVSSGRFEVPAKPESGWLTDHGRR